MHVVATAGHVDHGKSTLVRALTGTDPDRLAEEQRRGLTIELGYAWTALAGSGDVAFVDVPGHERFLTTMLAGVGPVPAALFVVAADDGWMPQSAEHLAALDAFGVRRAVLAVTRSDLADPSPAVARARAQLDRTSLAGSPAVPVSGRTGEGLDVLRRVLAEMVRGLPAEVPGDVRMWVDRRFSVKGSGTVVTGTLQSGAVAAGDELDLVGHAGVSRVRVRAVQSLGRRVASAAAVARCALNLSGASVAEVDRGGVLLAPAAWELTDLVDVRVRPAAAPHGPGGPSVPERPMVHVGAAAVSCRHRPLAAGLARLALDRPLPLRVGDRAVLRDPGTRALWGVTVLDPVPPPLRRRGAARERASALGAEDGRADLAAELRRRGIARAGLLARIGVPLAPLPADAVRVGEWLVDGTRAAALTGRIDAEVRRHLTANPLDPGVPVPALAGRLGIDAALVPALLPATCRLADGRVAPRRAGGLPAPVERSLAELEEQLAVRPYDAPTTDRLAELGLGPKQLAAAERAGRLLRLSGGVVLLAGADEQAGRLLGGLPQPFTVSQARERLGTSRRVALPLLALLDRRGITRRLPDDRRELNLRP